MHMGFYVLFIILIEKCESLHFFIFQDNIQMILSLGLVPY